MCDDVEGEIRIGFAPAAREEDARAAARGFAPRMRWTCPAQCWAVRRDAIVWRAVVCRGVARDREPLVLSGRK